MRKERQWNTFQKVLVASLILLVVFLMLTTRTLSIIAEQNTGMIGSGRTALTKGKDDSQMLLIEYKNKENIINEYNLSNN